MKTLGKGFHQHERGLVTSCLEAARYPDGSVRKVLCVWERAAADVDEEEFEGIFSIRGSLFGSMWPSMSPQAKQVEARMRRIRRIILTVLKTSKYVERSLITMCRTNNCPSRFLASC